MHTLPPRKADRSRFSIDALHLSVLSAFAVAQPLLDLLGRQPEFFAVRGSQPVDLWLLLAALCVAAPLPLLLFEGLIQVVYRRLRQLVHGVLCALLIAATLMPPLESLGAGPWVELGVTLVLGICGADALLRWRWARSLLTFMSPALIVFPAVFLLRPGVGKILQPADVEMAATADSDTPIVLLIFDELPLSSLLSAPLEFDAIRYPNFAALAGRATWYRHTAAASDFTILAVPAILSGRIPDAPYLPIATDYPQSLFTLVGETYAMNVSEALTQVCPAHLCSGDQPSESLGERLRSLASDLEILYLHVLLPRAWTGYLPPVDQNWMLFADSDGHTDWKRRVRGDRTAQVERFVEGIRPAEGPVLHMLHVLLPHSPYKYLPSGKRYSLTSHVIGLEGDLLPSDPWAVTQNQQRHLLQLGYADKILGQIVERLEESGLLDRAVVVVTADHGAAFEPGTRHRELTEKNFAQVLSVPLLIKAPEQRLGNVDERPASLVDVLPTIADLAGIELPWPVDGTSLAGPAATHRERFEYVLHRTELAERGSVAVAEFLASEDAALVALGEHFATNADGGRELFRIGDSGSLIGRRIAEQPIGSGAPFRYSLRLPADAFDINLDDPDLPAHLSGSLIGDVAAPVQLAVAVNGRIAAVTKSWTFAPDSWSAIIDPAAFHSGVNSVELFVIETALDGSLKALRPVDSMVDVAGSRSKP